MNNEQVLFNILRAVGQANTILDIAHELYLSQPYVSKVLRESERHYHVQLVIRKTHPIMLTSAGQTMLRDLHRVLNANQLLEENIRREQQLDSRGIMVIINNPFILMHADRVLTTYITEHPDLKMAVRFVPTASVADDLVNHICDLSIGPRYNQKELINQAVRSPELYLLFSKHDSNYESAQRIIPLNHQLIRKMEDYSYIGFTDNSNAQQYLDLEFKTFKMRRQFQVPSPQAAVRAVNRVAGSTTITTAEIAAATLPDSEYNLMTLPKNFLKLSETVTYLKTADDQVLDLVTYLENAL